MNHLSVYAVITLLLTAGITLGEPRNKMSKITWHGESRYLVQSVDTNTDEYTLGIASSTNAAIDGINETSPILKYQQKYYDVHDAAINPSGNLVALWVQGKLAIDKRNKLLVRHLDGSQNRYLGYHLCDKSYRGTNEVYRLNMFEIDSLLRDLAMKETAGNRLRLPLELDQGSVQFTSDTTILLSGNLGSAATFTVTLNVTGEELVVENAKIDDK